MCFWSESSSCPHFVWGGCGVKKERLLREQCLTEVLQELLTALQPLMASVCVTLLELGSHPATQVAWVEDAQHEPLLSLELCIAPYCLLMGMPTLCLLRFSPANSSICNWKKDWVTGRENYSREELEALFSADVFMVLSCIQNDQNTCLLFLLSPSEILETSKLNAGSRKWDWSDKEDLSWCWFWFVCLLLNFISFELFGRSR